MPDNRKFVNFPIAHRKVILWIIALLITLSSAVYQRLTGPASPIRGKVILGEDRISFKLLRTKTTGSDVEITLHVPDVTVGGYVRFRRYKSLDEWTDIPLSRAGDNLTAYLPQQPPAGKLMYFVYLEKDGRELSLTENKPVILRYKGGVPAAILLPHVLIIFLAMIWSNRTGLEALDANGKARRYMFTTIILFLLGGFIMGPLVQKYAFGVLWSGIPFGYDLTDNKVLIALFGWIWALWKNSRGKDNRMWIALAALLMLIIYMIPHSLLGSELDYTKLPQSPQPQ